VQATCGRSLKIDTDGLLGTDPTPGTCFVKITGPKEVLQGVMVVH
jgi:hypothetical protein